MAPHPFGSHYDYLVFDLIVDSPPAPQTVDRWVHSTLPQFGIKILGQAFTLFESPVPGTFAYTAVYVLSASHLAVHTAPEHRWVHVSFALCNASELAGRLEEAVRAFFAPSSLTRTQNRCGV
jgi:S-adenosylmethionine/arginine decarboxylase-like enzyme